MGITTSEFPLLNAAGLYVVHTAGNGKFPRRTRPGIHNDHRIGSH